MKNYNHYLHFIVTGEGTVAKFHTNAAPPQVGDVVDLSVLSTHGGTLRKVVHVKHIYFQEPENQISDEVEILLDDKRSPDINPMTGEPIHD